MADKQGRKDPGSEPGDYQIQLQQLIDSTKIPDNWPGDYTHLPVAQGAAIVDVDGAHYSAWLRRGDDGTFNQVELMTPREMNELYDNLPAGTQAEEKFKTIAVQVNDNGTETIVNDRVPPALHVPDDGLEYRVVKDIPKDIAQDRANRISSGTAIREAIQHASENLMSLQRDPSKTQPIVLTTSRDAIDQNQNIGFTPAPKAADSAQEVVREATPTSTLVAMSKDDFSAVIVAYTARPENGAADHYRPAIQELRSIDREMNSDPAAEQLETQNKITSVLKEYPGYADIIATYVQDRMDDGRANVKVYNGQLSTRLGELQVGNGMLSPKEEGTRQAVGLAPGFNTRSGAAASAIFKESDIKITDKDLTEFKPTGDLVEDRNRAGDILDAIKFQHMPADRNSALPSEQVAELVKDYRDAGYNDFADIMERMQRQSNEDNYAQMFFDGTSKLDGVYRKRVDDLRAQQEQNTDFPDDSIYTQEQAAEIRKSLEKVDPVYREIVCDPIKDNPAFSDICKP